MLDSVILKVFPTSVIIACSMFYRHDFFSLECYEMMQLHNTEMLEKKHRGDKVVTPH